MKKTPIHELGLEIRSYNALEALSPGLNTVEELKRLSKLDNFAMDLLGLQGVGELTYRDIVDKLAAFKGPQPLEQYHSNMTMREHYAACALQGLMEGFQSIKLERGCLKAWSIRVTVMASVIAREMTETMRSNES